MTQRCFRCARDRPHVAECFDHGFCFADEFLYRTYPYMQCGDCARDLHRTLSAQTSEMRWRFFAEHFGLPPDVHGREPETLEFARVPVWAIRPQG